MHLCRLFCQRHHQDRERDEHTAYDKQIYKIIPFAVCFIPSHRITHQRVKDHTEHNRHDRYHKAVSKGMPEVCQFHRLCEIAQAPFLRQGQDPGNTVRHLRRLLKCDHDRHIQRECHCYQSDKQKDRNRPVYSCFHFFIHYNCSSFLLDMDICATEIATITMKNTTALAL